MTRLWPILALVVAVPAPAGAQQTPVETLVEMAMSAAIAVECERPVNPALLDMLSARGRDVFAFTFTAKGAEFQEQAVTKATAHLTAAGCTRYQAEINSRYKNQPPFLAVFSEDRGI